MAAIKKRKPDPIPGPISNDQSQVLIGLVPLVSPLPSLTTVTPFGVNNGSFMQGNKGVKTTIKTYWAIIAPIYNALSHEMQKRMPRIKYTGMTVQTIGLKSVRGHDCHLSTMYDKDGLITLPDMWEKADGFMYNKENVRVRPAVYAVSIDGHDPIIALARLFDHSTLSIFVGIATCAISNEKIYMYNVGGLAPKSSSSSSSSSAK
jgi:hypothetical protein